ncbi:hypothetical protein REPUB_Repub01dG0237800 [Reevesia pubescens]
MISPKKLIKMARQWQRVAVLGRKRISLPRAKTDISSELADKDHFVVYTADEKRFVFPIAYLNNYIIRELLKMSEEEFGLPSNRSIILPCDAAFMEYAVSLIQRRVDRDLQISLLLSLSSCRCSSLSYSLNQTSQQIPICGF